MQASAPDAMKQDVLWKMTAYRQALFLADIAWQDVTRLTQDKRTVALADQLYRAIGSIGANIAEGYSRQAPRDRARFFEYALGSGREARHWYYQARHTLGDAVVAHRIEFLTEIIRLLIVTIPAERNRALRELDEEYLTEVGVAAQTQYSILDTQ